MTTKRSEGPTRSSLLSIQPLNACEPVADCCSFLLVSKFSISTDVTTLCELKAKGRPGQAVAKGHVGSTKVTSDMLGALESFE